MSATFIAGPEGSGDSRRGTARVSWRPAPRRLTDAVRDLGPNWFAVVMGTGIVASAGATLPLHVVGLRAFALVVWMLAAVLLAVLIAATVAHWILHPTIARSHLADPVMSHFYGAPPMAFLVVGAGALLVGRDAIGLPAALDLDWALWTSGTVFGLCTAVIVPYVAFTQHETRPDSAFGGWLMPVVPPMVSASTGALLAPYARPGQVRETLLLGCYAMFGVTLFASLIIVTQIWNRLVQHKIGPPAAVPTLWIVLGPLGQSITAANLIAVAAQRILPAPYAAGSSVFALLYGLPVWGFACLWLALALAITIRTARDHLPFSLTWWSFTFAVGTVVTGTSGLAVRTGLTVLTQAAVALYIFLLIAWVLVLTRTFHAVWRGSLLNPASQSRSDNQGTPTPFVAGAGRV